SHKNKFYMKLSLLLDIEQSSSLRDNMASLSLREESTTIASYSLCDGLQVFVCQGDITKQHTDALVNAANQDLEHSAGVAAALSRAGGPEIQRESDELVKCLGKIPIGDTVVTTGGNLKCKKLLHAVGPVGGKASNRDKMLLEKTVHCALKFSEIMEFQSIAIPCISSGVSGVPLTVCTEATVAAVKDFGSVGGRNQRCLIKQIKAIISDKVSHFPCHGFAVVVLHLHVVINKRHSKKMH
uniref:Macro domain-containing protein n=1 Tax=Maylandia zebra TaxID=106582 RepID=A0A3P9CZT2_9CICH